MVKIQEFCIQQIFMWTEFQDKKSSENKSFMYFPDINTPEH